MEQKLHIYKLRFITPLHLSRGKLNSYESSGNTIHSDTLKSALFVSVLHLYGLNEAKKFMNDLQVSSCLPYDAHGCWLPRPMSFSFGAIETSDNRKEFKRVGFLTISQFNQVSCGEKPSLLFDEAGKLAQPDIWEKDVTQRVKINYDSDSEPFYLEKLYSRETCGVYFIYNGTYDSVKLDAAVRLLSDNGIGLQRSLGNGQFESSKDTIHLEFPSNANSWMSVSLYRPFDKNEVENILPRSSYQFVKRGGWIASPEEEAFTTLRKKSVMMFIEGSVFGFSADTTSVLVKGKTENLRPEWNDPTLHDIYRDGKAIFLPII